MANFKIHGIDNLLKTLQALPKEVTQSKRGGIAAKAVRAGAKVIHDEEKVTLQRASDINGDESSGLLMQNLKVRRNKYCAVKPFKRHAAATSSETPSGSGITSSAFIAR